MLGVLGKENNLLEQLAGELLGYDFDLWVGHLTPLYEATKKDYEEKKSQGMSLPAWTKIFEGAGDGVRVHRDWSWLLD